MKSIHVRNVNEALPLGMMFLRDQGLPIAPRGNATLELDGPFSTTYSFPEEMVLYDPDRDANPFFHFFEALWILEGRDDVQFLKYFLPRMAEFSDDGRTFHAPYGYRLRKEFDRTDQIELAIQKLQSDPDSRQAVMVIWNPLRDWVRTKDVPCNDMVMLKVRNGKLRMTVCNRSNDAVLGAYGANVVQFSTLLCYMAGRIGVDVGQYTQVSDSFHVYKDNPYWKLWNEKNPAGVSYLDDPYALGHVDSGSFFLQKEEINDGRFDEDLDRFFDEWNKAAESSRWDGQLMNPIADMKMKLSSKLMNERFYLTTAFSDTALPMLQTFDNWKNGKKDVAMETVKHIRADDWRIACRAWMQRRLDKAESK